MEIKLLNVARASIGELRQDYEDFLKSRHKSVWEITNARYQQMQEFTRQHNELGDYEQYFSRWDCEEMANVAITLCYQIDAMINKYLHGVEQSFITEGGIKERMYNARTKQRQIQEGRIKDLEEELAKMNERATLAEGDAKRWQAAYNDLKQRALNAYKQQQQEIAKLQSQLQSQ